MTAKFCHQDNSDITSEKTIVTPANVFNLTSDVILRRSNPSLPGLTPQQITCNNTRLAHWF